MSKNIYINGTYEKNNPTWDVEDSFWKAKQILKIMNKNGIRPKSVCDVGCGAGEVLNQLYSQMPTDVDFVGYEISPQAFKLCQQRKKKRLRFCLGDFLKEEKTFFDLLLVIDVVEHIEDYFSFLRKLRQKGEYKIFHIPLELSVQMVLRVSPLLRARRKVGHLHHFNKEIALELLNETGYEIIDYFYTGVTVDLPAKSFPAFLAKLPRRVMFCFNQDLTVRLLGGYSLMVLAK